FHDTAAPARKPVPVTFMEKAGPPTAAVEGEMLVMVGGEARMARTTEFDAGPVGLASVTCADPTWLIRWAGTAAVTCVALPKVVARGVPFKDTTAPDWKPVPTTVIVNVGPPTVTLDGEILVMTGGGAVIVNVAVL